MTRITGSRAAKLIRLSAMALFALMMLMTLASMTKFFTACAQGNESEVIEDDKSKEVTAESASVKKWGFLAASISVGLGSIAGGIAVAYVGSAALGVIAEKPEAAGRALIFVGLAEGIAIYGVIVAILILYAK